MRTIEELMKLPIAVILDEELVVLTQECKTELDMELIKVIVKGRGIEDKFPELWI